VIFTVVIYIARAAAACDARIQRRLRCTVHSGLYAVVCRRRGVL
jgi:hypothetical protein